MLSIVVATVLATAPFAPEAQAAPVASATLALPTPTFAYIHKRPRRRPVERRTYDRGATGFSQVHAGWFDGEDDRATSILFGFRGGTSFDERLQLGVGLDWSHHSDRATSVISETTLPGGGSTVRREELARSSSHLVPVMAFVQFAPGEGLPVQPYFGLGGGYEVLWVSAEDFETGAEYDATFGGWGWQGWAGVAIPLGGRTNLTGELYLNQAEVERDVDDPGIGARVREVVDLDGGGMRFGVNWLF